MVHQPPSGCSRRAAMRVLGMGAAAYPTIAGAAPDLPADWASAVDPSSGNTFYYNKKTNESSWDPPTTTTTATAGRAQTVLSEPDKNAMRASNKDVGACKSGE